MCNLVCIEYIYRHGGVGVVVPFDSFLIDSLPCFTTVVGHIGGRDDFIPYSFPPSFCQSLCFQIIW